MDIAAKWQSRVVDWLNKRIPSARSFTLDIRSIFIIPSRFGAAFLLLCVGLFLLGTNYQNNLMLLLCYFLLALFLINLFTSYLNFSRLKISLGNTQDVYAGEDIRFPIWLSAVSTDVAFPHGKLHLRFWQQANELEVDLDLSHNPVWVSLPTRCRGEVRMPRLTVSSYYPLGLYRCWTHLLFEQQSLVYPKPIFCELTLDCSARSSEPDGAHALAQGHDDIDGLKAYQQGDPLYHVAWKQVAKGQGMVSKLFNSTQSSSGWLRLLPCSPDNLERKLGQLCFQVNQLSQQQVRYGLDLGNVQIEPGSGLQHQEACLAALARFDWKKHA